MLADSSSVMGAEVSSASRRSLWQTRREAAENRRNLVDERLALRRLGAANMRRDSVSGVVLRSRLWAAAGPRRSGGRGRIDGVSVGSKLHLGQAPESRMKIDAAVERDRRLSEPSGVLR